MCITEYDEKETLKAIGEEYFAEGKAEGRAECRKEDISSIDKLVESGLVPADIADIIISRLSENGSN